MKNPRMMTDSELSYTRKDLNEVIEIQEAGIKVGMHCPELGRYWDELHAILGEVSRRVRRGGTNLGFDKGAR